MLPFLNGIYPKKNDCAIFNIVMFSGIFLPVRREEKQQARLVRQTQALVKECMAAALPVIESVVMECLQSRNIQSNESPAVQPGPSVTNIPSTQPWTENVVGDNL